jgi:hypothetical protein
MAKTVVANVGDELLSSATEHSDRYVYCNYFVPRLVTFDDDKTPILPFYTKQQILEVAKYGLVDPDRLVTILRELGYKELWEKNAMSEAQERLGTSPTPNGGILPTIGHSLRDADELLETLSPRLEEADRELLLLVSRRLSESSDVLLDMEEGTVRTATDPRSVAIAPSEDGAARPTILTNQDAEFIAGLLQSDVGFVFLDRTRISPVGFAVGEHVYALSLAPGEEVTLEQKSFTKRQVTFEEQNEQEKQFDIELSSALSTEIQEGFDRQHSLSDSWGLSASQTTQYSSPQTPYGQINAGYTIGFTKNVTEASQESARRSVKDGQTASSKVSARYRTQHKTTFRVVSEAGFETTSKRTIRNPNRTTPVTLHYFKVLERLKMQQERYGVRLCWAPSVKDPALTFFDKIRKGRQYIIDEAVKSLPPMPVEPKPPDSVGTPTTRETKPFVSPIITADKWGTSGDMRADYEVDIPYDSGYTWDGDVSAVERSINVITRRPQETVSRWVVGLPYPVKSEGGDKLRVTVHIGAPMWLGGPGIEFQVSATFYKDVTITEEVGENTKYNDDLAAYRIALRDWTDQRDAALAAAYKAADDFEQQLLDRLNPVNEMVSQIIEQHFPASVRDESWEVDYWQRLFDWERANFVAYPSWWSNSETRNPLLDPSDFLNASWAKLYLPVKVGMEQLALRWIFGKTVAFPLVKGIEDRFTALITELRKFRRDVLGAVDEVVDLAKECQEAPEKFRCLATWTELMPTDGTHMEVVQGATNAADDITGQEIADAAGLRKALLESERWSAKLKDQAHQKMSEPAKIEVQVGAGGSSAPGQP